MEKAPVAAVWDGRIESLLGNESYLGKSKNVRSGSEDGCEGVYVS